MEKGIIIHRAPDAGRNTRLLFTEKTPVDKGWSGEKKYSALDESGNRYLLRVSSPETLSQKKTEFDMMLRVHTLGVRICAPIALYETQEGVISVHEWIFGRDLEEAFPFLTEEEKYLYGLEAGRMLIKIHSIPAPDHVPDWGERFQRKIDRKLEMYAACPLKYDNGERMTAFIEENRRYIQSCPQSFQHGDYHSGNMMLDSEGRLTVIDFNRFDFGDPVEELNRIVWSAQLSGNFACGMVDGYTENSASTEFFLKLAVYIANNSLGSLPWAISYGDKEIAVMQKQALDILSWYDGFHTVIPSWYAKCPFRRP